MSKIGKEISNQNLGIMKSRAEMMMKNQMSSIAPNLLPGVKPQDLIEIKCSNCQAEVFYPAHTLKFASRFQSRNSMPTLVQFPLGFACATCGQINPFDAEALAKGTTDQDGQKQKTQQEENKPSSGDLGVSVSDGVSAKEKLN